MNRGPLIFVDIFFFSFAQQSDYWIAITLMLIIFIPPLLDQGSIMLLLMECNATLDKFFSDVTSFPSLLLLPLEGIFLYSSLRFNRFVIEPFPVYQLPLLPWQFISYPIIF